MSEAEGSLGEDEVYLACKDFLVSSGWVLLGGQPPDGSNHLPVVEIRDPAVRTKGSQGSYKPDLIATRRGAFLLVECKPDHDETDAAKLRQILSADSRKTALYSHLTQRHLFERRGLSVDQRAFTAGLFGCLAHSGEPQRQSDLVVLIVSRAFTGSFFVAPRECPTALRDALLEDGG